MSEHRDLFHATAGSDFRDALTELADEVAKTAGETAGAMRAYEAGIKVEVWLNGADGKAEFTKKLDFVLWENQAEKAEWEAENVAE